MPLRSPLLAVAKLAAIEWSAMTERPSDSQHVPACPADASPLIAPTKMVARTALAKASLLITGTALAAVSLSLRPRENDEMTAAVHLREDDAHVTLDDLQSDAASLLRESDGVDRVEHLVAVPHPRYRIIHIADWHTVPADLYAADLRDVDDSLTDEEIEQDHAFSDAVTKVVQASQRQLLRRIGRHEGVHCVHVEGVTDSDLSAYLTLVRSVGRHGPDFLPPHFGAAAQALIAGDIKELAPAEDESAHERAAIEAVGQLVFDGPANAAREAAIVRRLIESGPLSVIMLGGDHDLSTHVRAIPGCEYLRVFVRNDRKITSSFPF
jgi:hypothetical protein